MLRAIGLKHSLPAPWRRQLRWLQQYPDARRLAADSESFTTFRRISNPQYETTDRTPVAVRFKPLGGAEIFLRPGSTDSKMAWLALRIQPHLPSIPPRLIWDIGANIGITMAHAAHLYPQARIVGLEPDQANAALARMNTRAWRDRCELVEAAAWTEDGEVMFASRPGAEAGGAITTGEGVAVRALALNSLLQLTGPPDFVKIDIEGSEKVILNECVEWAHHVPEIAIECHGEYGTNQCAEDLASLGFTPEVRTHRLSVPTVSGIRQPSQIKSSLTS